MPIFDTSDQITIINMPDRANKVFIIEFLKEVRSLLLNLNVDGLLD